MDGELRGKGLTRKGVFAQVIACLYICKQSLAYKMRRDVFQAIADPTRRGILVSLTHAPQNINALADQFDMTRQAVSLHIKILQECGVISVSRDGRQRYCTLEAGELVQVADWLAPFREMWESRFNQLDTVLHELKSKSKDQYDE